jgi:hypothetical protein
VSVPREARGLRVELGLSLRRGRCIPRARGYSPEYVRCPTNLAVLISLEIRIGLGSYSGKSR